MPARMTATRMMLLGAALTPYLALVGVDAWMHERARSVPRIEQALHYAAAILFVTFLVAVFRDSIRLAGVLLLVFVACTAWDEIGYHGTVDVRERRVHFAAIAALVFFLVAWSLTMDMT